MEINVYVENGYEDRAHYLSCMSEDYNLELEAVYHLSELLGEDEDFDGLVVALEDEEENQYLRYSSQPVIYRT